MNQDEFDRLLDDLTQRLQHLTEDELNYLLEALIHRVQQQSPVTPERRRLLDGLARVLSRSPWFRRQRPRRLNYPDRYDQIHAEAVSLFWVRVCRGIDNFRTGRSRAALRWVVFLLDRCVADASRVVLGDPKVKVRSLDDLDDYLSDPPQPDAGLSTLDLVEACIDEDVDGLFQKHIENYPQATFQVICQLRREERSWQQVADQLGISSQQTVHSFYKRCLKRFQPVILAYVQEYGQFS